MHSRRYYFQNCFTDMVQGCDFTFTDCLAENPQYQDEERMCTLLRRRDAEMRAVYNEKDLVDVVVKMSHKLEDRMTGMRVA